MDTNGDGRMDTRGGRIDTLALRLRGRSQERIRSRGPGAALSG